MAIDSGPKAGEAREAIAEVAAQQLELIEVMQSTFAGKRHVINDAELDMLLDRRKEVSEGRGIGWILADVEPLHMREAR